MEGFNMNRVFRWSLGSLAVLLVSAAATSKGEDITFYFPPTCKVSTPPAETGKVEDQHAVLIETEGGTFVWHFDEVSCCELVKERTVKVKAWELDRGFNITTADGTTPAKMNLLIVKNGKITEQGFREVHSLLLPHADGNAYEKAHYSTEWAVSIPPKPELKAPTKE